MIEAGQPAGFWRRGAALVYDGFLVLALWLLSSLALVAATGGELGGPLYQAFLYVQAAGFYLYFWRVRGQTLGMQVWKLRLVNEAGELVSFWEGCVRCFFGTLSFGCFGLGFLWMLVDPERLAWHDRASGTYVIYLGKDAYARE